MSRTIHLPPGKEGDEIAKQMIPKLWLVARGEVRDRRSSSDEEGLE